MDFQVSSGMWELSLAQTRGRDSTGLPVGQPCSESLSPNLEEKDKSVLEVKGKSVFLKTPRHAVVIAPDCTRDSAAGILTGYASLVAAEGSSAHVAAAPPTQSLV